MSDQKALLLFQAGPVQDFIVAARSTRDLWSGSYLLAWLMITAARAVKSKAGTPASETFIFPHVEELGVWKAQEGIPAEDIAVELTPSMPNRFSAIVPVDLARACACAAEEAFRKELTEISEAVFSALPEGLKTDRKRWDAQVALFPEITWQACPIDGDDYEKAYKKCQALLAARRNTRGFCAFNTDENQNGALKDALTGREEIIGGEDFWKRLQQPGEDVAAFDEKWENAAEFKPNEGPYGAISIIKRKWPYAYLFDKKYKPRGIGADTFYEGGISYLSLPEVAERNENSKANPYVAVIAMDGDQMGRWMDGERRLLGAGGQKLSLRESQSVFSKRLAEFSKNCGKIVNERGGQLIYAGGDDVLAVVPATNALSCARKLRDIFYKTVGNDADGRRADVSCGIAVAHKKYPLQSIVREASGAEHRAKEEYNRGAFSFSLLKHSGEIVHWGGKWDEGGVCDLFEKYCQIRGVSGQPAASNSVSAPTDGDGKFIISARFPYALAERLAPYALEKSADVVPGLNVGELIKAELKTVMERQTEGTKTSAGKDFEAECATYVDHVVKTKRYDDFVKLFLTAAFISRERAED